jgi:hypothetical protein
MHIRKKFALPVIMVLAFLPAAGNAYACSGGHSSGTAYAAEHHAGGVGVFSVAKTYLGLSGDQIKTQLRDGKSLADIANATPGKSANGLVAAITAALTTKLAAAVTAGKISSTQEATILAAAAPKIDTFVNKTWSFESHHKSDQNTKHHDNDNDGD